MINEEQFVKVPMWILKISQVNGHKFTDIVLKTFTAI